MIALAATPAMLAVASSPSPSSPAKVPFVPLLFMDRDQDAEDIEGVVTTKVQQMQAAPKFALPFAAATPLGTFQNGPNEFELFGIVPCAPLNCTEVWRWTSSDLRTWSEARTVFHADGRPWYPKSMARDERSMSNYVMLVFSDGSASLDVNPDSVDYGWSAASVDGLNFSFTKDVHKADEPNFMDHDDANLLWSNGTYIDMQIAYEHFDKRFPDNIGSKRRRTVSARTCLAPGFPCEAWSPQLKAKRTPDAALDPPDLEFYQLRPSVLGASGRIVAAVLTYAPAPTWLPYGTGYGLQPNHPLDCPHQKESPAKEAKFGPFGCHGPHIGYEWWVAGRRGPLDVEGWTRPDRLSQASPSNGEGGVISPFAPAVTHGDQHVWLTSGGDAFALPLYRVAGLRAHGNAALSTPAFKMPKTESLWLNVEAAWGAGRAPGSHASCNELCNAYVAAELYDAATRTVIPGLTRDKCVLLDVDDLRAPLEWEGVNASKLVGGQQVFVRFFFRSATIYAIGAGRE